MNIFSKIRSLAKKGVSFHLLPLTICLLLVSCDELHSPDIDDILSSDEETETVGDALQITNIVFPTIIRSWIFLHACSMTSEGRT